MAKLNNWIQIIADQIEKRVADKKDAGTAIYCASGISPSGVIHLGNLREIITVHFVTTELLNRGRKAVHLHFWDDYDRFRKVPANISPDFEKYIGKPLSEVPDPFGDHGSYADHFKSEFRHSLEVMGIYPEYISQTAAYQQGTYNQLIKESLIKREQIFEILNQHQKEEQQKNKEQLKSKYYPFKAYCSNCGKDDTRLQDYVQETATVNYSCNFCGNKEIYSLNDKVQGKLVWKVDWPMRWKHYGIDFEPGGLDHSTPGSSYTVGKQVVMEVFHQTPPHYVGYAFVGISGGTNKISSSAGTDATPANALAILEPPMLRWLYVRSEIKSSFNINFDDQIFRIYDEWDRLMQRVKDGKADENEKFIFNTCTRVGDKEVPHSKFTVPFRLLASTYDITQGNREEIFRILNHHIESPYFMEELFSKIGMRLKCAANWVEKFLPIEERIRVKEHFDQPLFDQFDADTQEAIEMLGREFQSAWNLNGLTNLLYNIPKRQLGLPPDVKPTDELKQRQSKFFNALYRLLLDRDAGPRLPTLFLSIGAEKLKQLIMPSVADVKKN
jgi:lysyl-tRNA synthetase class 1